MVFNKTGEKRKSLENDNRNRDAGDRWDGNDCKAEHIGVEGCPHEVFRPIRGGRVSSVTLRSEGVRKVETLLWNGAVESKEKGLSDSSKGSKMVV